MGFYNEISYDYDLIFPEDEATTDYLTKSTKEGSKVLDLACGTGTYTVAMAERNFLVTGIDFDKNMIEIAKEKEKGKGLNVKFLAGDMLDFKDKLGDDKFDLIYCIGNSLVHITDKTKLQRLLEDICSSLSEEGKLIVQIINYDRIIENKISSLPTIENQGIKFERNYIYEDGIIQFSTVLHTIDKTIKNTIPLLPLLKEELVELMRKAGFNNITMFGDFNEGKFTKDSYILVLNASV